MHQSQKCINVLSDLSLSDLTRQVRQDKFDYTPLWKNTSVLVINENNEIYANLKILTQLILTNNNLFVFTVNLHSRQFVFYFVGKLHETALNVIYRLNLKSFRQKLIFRW